MKKEPNIYMLCWLLAACSMVGPFATDMYLPSFHAMAEDFSTDLAHVQITLSAYLAGFAVMTLFYGTISDVLGRRLTMIGGFVCFAAASLAAALSGSLTALIICRTCQGIFAGCGMVVGMAVIRDLYGGVQAQKLMAYVSMVFGLGPAAAPVLGGWFATHLPWTSHFWTLAAIGTALAVLCFIFLPESLPPEKRMKPHFGTLLKCYAGAAKHKPFMLANSALALAFLGQGVFIAGAADWCVEVMGLAPNEFWKLFLPMVSGTVFGSWISTRVAQRLGTALSIRTGFAVMFLAAVLALCCITGIIPAQKSVWFAVLPLGCYTIGIGIVRPGMALVAMDFFPSARGLAASMQSFIQTVFFALCSAFFVPLLYGHGAYYDWAIVVIAVLTVVIWEVAMNIRLESKAPH